MDKTATIIAEKLNCSRFHVSLVLRGKRSPFTNLGLQITDKAAEIHAEKCKNEFMLNIFKTYKLHKSIDKMKADLIQECKKHETKNL